MTSLVLENVGVTYPLFELRNVSLKGSIAKAVGGALSSSSKSTNVQSLSDISVELKEGDRIGILGHNGAGKTTFLKVCAGILEPTSGYISVEGSTASLTDITMGMDPEVSGYENIIRRGVFMGLNRKEARDLIPPVREFSELGDYLELPMRTYSTGMYLRLAFAVSTTIVPDILIMDELIGAGDASFIEKAQQRMNSLLEDANIIILASHSMDLLRQVCDKGMLLQGGQCRFQGPIDEAIEIYLESLAK